VAGKATGAGRTANGGKKDWGQACLKALRVIRRNADPKGQRGREGEKTDFMERKVPKGVKGREFGRFGEHRFYGPSRRIRKNLRYQVAKVNSR